MIDMTFEKALFSLVSATIALLVREVFALRRERRDAFRKEVNSLSTSMELNYFGEKIRDCREVVEMVGGIEAGLPKNDRNLYLLGVSMQQAGINCLLSNSSLEHVLMGNAPQITRDWVLIYHHVEHVRGEKINSQVYPFSRRHGEWLAILSYLWLIQQEYNLPDNYQECSGIVNLAT